MLKEKSHKIGCDDFLSESPSYFVGRIDIDLQFSLCVDYVAMF